VGGAIVGAIGLTLLTLVLHWVLIPKILEYWLAPIITIPCGLLLGAITSLYWLIPATNKNSPVVALLSLAGSTAVFGGTGLIWADFSNDGILLITFVALPILWALALLIAAARRFFTQSEMHSESNTETVT